MDKLSIIVRELPLHSVLGSDGAERLRYEIQRAAREFGYEQLQQQAAKYGAATISVRFEIRQPWETE